MRNQHLIIAGTVHSKKSYAFVLVPFIVGTFLLFFVSHRKVFLIFGILFFALYFAIRKYAKSTYKLFYDPETDEIIADNNSVQKRFPFHDILACESYFYVPSGQSDLAVTYYCLFLKGRKKIKFAIFDYEEVYKRNFDFLMTQLRIENQFRAQKFREINQKKGLLKKRR